MRNEVTGSYITSEMALVLDRKLNRNKHLFEYFVLSYDSFDGFLSNFIYASILIKSK